MVVPWSYIETDMQKAKKDALRHAILKTFADHEVEVADRLKKVFADEHPSVEVVYNPGFNEAVFKVKPMHGGVRLYRVSVKEMY